MSPRSIMSSMALLSGQLRSAISKAQISKFTYKSVKLWVEGYEAYMKVKGYKFQNVMNVDKMRIKLQNSNSQSRNLKRTLIARSGEIKGGKSKHASFILFVVATGERVMDVLILPLEFGNLQLEDHDARFGLNNKTQVILLFSETDGFPFPANTTHFLRPLDNVLFANLKNTIVRLYRTKTSYSQNLLGSLGKELVPIALEARYCLKPELIHTEPDRHFSVQ
ncbi:hypothetical protein BCR33DRAFT_818007 [Rhizoclosmatium globosum]|uniref:Uncharacterized protein n=1 Tax=Rhizoclosmatium globosum TaxID=329046 RepID=A0A1Y2AEQ1_9FUNG|nr:hypothetical protein BCR33DRAFT_818007 [Rhizoclosmatium globosum]|eukprot:ORY20760.1 hypothetical protein BCR33DRAFT_818007 [Rhizoclosmatium globosum]